MSESSMSLPREVRKSQLRPAQQELIKLMAKVYFGRLENLTVRDGLPVMHPAPKCVKEIKFCGESGPQVGSWADDFALKAQAQAFLQHLQQMKDGVIDCLVIKHGLPFSMSVQAAAA